MNMQIAMVGTGYVGLVTGACLADLGHDVVCIDSDASKIEGLLVGRMPIYEPGLAELVARNVAAGRLTFSTDLSVSVKGRDAVFIAVGTPTRPDSEHADLRYVDAAAQEIARNVDQFTVVVTKSTVPVGTNRRVHDILQRTASDPSLLAVASNPEFLREGSAIDDFMHPDRVVFGVESARAGEVMTAIYAPLAERGHQVLGTEIETAEVIKYAANAFLAVKISYINEIADLCEVAGADVERVANAIGLDRRIGRAFLNAGPGWGGSCFPKDTRALKAIAADHLVPLRVVEAAIEANTRRKDNVVQKIADACGGTVAGKRIAVFGLTFKGNTDDIRESPSIDVIRELCTRGARVRAYDPSQPDEARRALPNLVMKPAAVDTVRDADVLVVLTDWQSFTEIDLAEMAAHMADPVLVDLRNLYEEDAARQSGFRHYVRLGRRARAAALPVRDAAAAAGRDAWRLLNRLRVDGEVLTPAAVEAPVAVVSTAQL